MGRAPVAWPPQGRPDWPAHVPPALAARVARPCAGCPAHCPQAKPRGPRFRAHARGMRWRAQHVPAAPAARGAMVRPPTRPRLASARRPARKRLASAHLQTRRWPAFALHSRVRLAAQRWGEEPRLPILRAPNRPAPWPVRPVQSPHLAQLRESPHACLLGRALLHRGAGRTRRQHSLKRPAPPHRPSLRPSQAYQPLPTTGLDRCSPWHIPRQPTPVRSAHSLWNYCRGSMQRQVHGADYHSVRNRASQAPYRDWNASERDVAPGGGGSSSRTDEK